jgi:hypothetical protein
MSITTYGELQTALGNWLKRSNLTQRIPEFIALAEARFRRKLDDLDQDTTATVTLTDGVGALPANFGALKSVHDATFGRVEYVTPSQFADYDATETGDFPVVFTIIGSQVKTLPASTGAVSITYKLGIPALTASNTTNWLLTRAPDIYLYGTLLQAEFYGWNDERLPLIKSALDEAMEELNVDSERRRHGPAPLSPRIARN